MLLVKVGIVEPAAFSRPGSAKAIVRAVHGRAGASKGTSAVKVKVDSPNVGSTVSSWAASRRAGRASSKAIAARVRLRVKVPRIMANLLFSSAKGQQERPTV